MKKKATIQLYFIFLIFTPFYSCKKLIEVELPKNQLVTTSVFSDSINAIGAVSGIYSDMMNVSTQLSFGNGSITVFTGMASDELYPTSVTNVQDNEFFSNNISVENGINHALWFQAYKIIYQTNACIDGIENSKNLSTALSNQLIGECKVIRSFIYFNLVNLFGDIPYVTNINYKYNAVLPRVSKDSIFNNLIAELLHSRQLLSAGLINVEKVRASKMATNALLARIYLYSQKWNEAEQYSSEILNSGTFIIEPVLNNVFLAGSREAIWQLRPIQPAFNTAEGQVLNPSSSSSVRPKYGISTFLMNAFEPGDRRKNNLNWIKSKVVVGESYFYPFKYKLKSDVNPNPSEYYIVLRLAEQFLIRSEAYAQQGKNIEALSDLNIIRNRAGLLSINPPSKEDILKAIEQERRVELFAEWGHRWFDLKRWNKTDAVLGPQKASNWEHTDKLFPIPFIELQRNPFLIQNPGY